MTNEYVYPEIDNGAMFERPGKCAPFMRGAELLAILQSERAFTGAQLARKLGVELRTLRRYIKELRDLGFAIEAHHGHYGGYQLARGRTMPPLHFTEEEMETIIGALSYSQHPNDDFAERAAELEGRLRRLMPEELYRRVDRVSSLRFAEALKQRAIQREAPMNSAGEGTGAARPAPGGCG